MKNKHLILFACFLVVLIALYVIQEQRSKITVVETGARLIFPDLDTGSVVEVRAYLGADDRKLVFTKSDDVWRIPSRFNARADTAKIDNLLKDLQELKGEIRASDADLFSVFELEDGQALHLDLVGADDRILSSLLVGKKGPAGAGCFVRVEGGQDIALVDKNLLSTFGMFGKDRALPPSPKQWLDLKIVPTPMDRWTRVEMIQPSLSLVLEKEREGPEPTPEQVAQLGEEARPPMVWVQKEPSEPALTRDDMVSALKALERLRGVDVADPASSDSYGLDKPEYRAVVTLDDKSGFELRIARPQETGPVYAKLDTDAQIFEISEAGLKTSFGKLKEKLTGGSK